MWRAEFEELTPRQLRGFQRLLGAALLARLGTDFHSGIWRVHTGELFPWRHLPGVPLYPPGLLVIEWGLLGAAAAGLLLGRMQHGALRIGLLATAMGLSQRYANQNALLFLVLLYANLKVVTPASLPPEGARFPNFALLRLQLIIVYAFSAANKVLHGFLSGEAIGNLFGMRGFVPQAAAWGVVAAEVIIAVLLCGRSRLGFAAAVVLHGVFALSMPGIWPFSLLMLAMAVLFVRARPAGPTAPNGR